MKRTFISIAGTMLLAAAIGAQSLSVSYVEGDAEARQAQSWNNLVIGDPVAANATVRLGVDSYLEITGRTQSIAISQPGTYSLSSLIAQAMLMKSAGVGPVLSKKLAALFSASLEKSSTLGVRAAKAQDTSGIAWVASDAGVSIDSAKKHIAAGDYRKAIEQLKEAVVSASSTELPVARYYLGYAYSLSGKTRLALEQLGRIKPADIAPRAAGFVVLKGKLLLDTNAYQQDVAWLTAHAAVVGGDSERAPIYYLLLGLSYQGTGDSANARRNLRKAASLSPSTDVGRTAAKLLHHR